MKALVLEGVTQLSVRDHPNPNLIPDGAILRVKANGVCRSDWHGWIGDSKRNFPVVMGHEFSGVVEEVGPGVKRFRRGDRVVVPFSGGDGICEFCRSGHSNVCDHPHGPGRTYSGGYAEYVCVPLADHNLMHLPDEVGFVDGAALGCRFMTAYHGIVDRAQVGSGEWVVVYGCGGVGLSAINIAASLGARVIGVDVNASNLQLAMSMGAEVVINSLQTNPVESVMELTRGGAHVSVDALGIAETCVGGILSLRKTGRHLQLGVTTKKEAGYVSVPVDHMVLRELSFVASVGMPAHRYDTLIPLVARGRLTPGKMVSGEISLSDVSGIFERMSTSSISGVYVVTEFR